MKKSHHQLNGLLIAGVVFSFTTATPFFALAETSAKKSSPSAQTTSDAIEVPRSLFTIPTKVGDGRDPFFPVSRRMVVEAKPDKGGDTPKPAAVSLLLKGISRGAGTKRYALINDKTFTVGDEHEVVVNNSRARVHCIEIKEDSVLIEINGTRQELRMRPGI
jgi:hypothetical protein